MAKRLTDNINSLYFEAANRMTSKKAKQLIGLVLKLNPNIQIIMTTHSPAVVMDGWMDHVTEVDDITIK